MKITIKQRDGTTQIIKEGNPNDFIKCPYCRYIVDMNTHDFDECRKQFFNDILKQLAIEREEE